MDGVGGEGVSDGQGVEVRAKTTDPGALVVGLLVAAFVLLGLAWVVPWGSATQQDSFGPVMGQTVTVDSRGTLYLWGATFEINMSTSGSDSGRVSWFDRIEDPENPGALAVARVGIVFVLLGCVAALASFGVVARRERTLAAVPAVAAGLAALGGILFHSALLMDLQPGFVVGAAPVALMAAVAALAATAALTYRRAPAIAPLVAEA